ncbi:MAG: hypothetical protein NTY53_07555, partial [Kiritimatiellaeota bacterium]|nr:hypothetical protein [Kiritimatiellota bacterium]
MRLDNRFGSWIFALVTFLVPCMTVYAQTSFIVTKLIGDLNDNAEANAKARKELIQMGRQTVPGLIEEIKKYAEGKEDSLISAARCFRVMREMKNDAAVDIAIDILSALTPAIDLSKMTTACPPAQVLLSESLYYISDMFDSPKARVAFLRFVLNSQEKWLCTYQEHQYLILDVFYGIERLVAKKDLEAPALLTKLMNSCPYQYILYSKHLANDGFQTQSVVRYPAGGDAKTFFPDPKFRARIVVMRWLRDLDYKPAVSAIQPLLRSPNKDERDFALIVLEQLADKIASGTGEAAIPSADVVTLRNGDVISGRVGNEVFSIRTSYASLSFKVTEIARIQFQTAATKADDMELRVGDRLAGALVDTEIKVTLKAGGAA